MMLKGAHLPAAGPGDPGVVRVLIAGTLHLTVVALLGLAIGALVLSDGSSPYFRKKT